ncbi:hypothetical protein Tco_1411185 [Tanacetum coccineum]
MNLRFSSNCSKNLSPKLGSASRNSKECVLSWFFTHAPIRYIYNYFRAIMFNDSLNSLRWQFALQSPNEGATNIENKAKVRWFIGSRDASEYECSSNLLLTYHHLTLSSNKWQRIEDKMTLTFRNEMNEMKNMMKALVPTPAPIKAVEERCTTCGSNHSFNVCPMTRGGYESPVYHDNFQQFQQTASVGMVPYQSPPQNSQIVLASQLDTFKKTTEGSMQVMRNHITNLKAEIRSEVQATLQNQINSLKGEFKNELKSQHNLFMNQQNDFQNNLQNMLSGFFQKSATFYFYFLCVLPLYLVIPSQIQGVKLEPLRLEADFLTHRISATSTKDFKHPVIQKSHDPVKPVGSPISTEPSSAQVDNSPPSKEPSKETRLPYPSKVEYEKKSKNDKEQMTHQKFWEMFKKIHVDITLADALDLISSIKVLKSFVEQREVKRRMAKFTGLLKDSRQISPKVNSEPLIESLPKDDFDNDDDLFEMDSNNDEWKRILYGEDFEKKNFDSDKIKVFDKSSSNVFKSLSDELEPMVLVMCRKDLDFPIGDAFSQQSMWIKFHPGI